MVLSWFKPATLRLQMLSCGRPIAVWKRKAKSTVALRPHMCDSRHEAFKSSVTLWPVYAFESRVELLLVLSGFKPALLLEEPAVCVHWTTEPLFQITKINGILSFEPGYIEGKGGFGWKVRVWVAFIYGLPAQVRRRVKAVLRETSRS